MHRPVSLKHPSKINSSDDIKFTYTSRSQAPDSTIKRNQTTPNFGDIIPRTVEEKDDEDDEAFSPKPLPTLGRRGDLLHSVTSILPSVQFPAVEYASSQSLGAQQSTQKAQTLKPGSMLEVPPKESSQNPRQALTLGPGAKLVKPGYCEPDPNARHQTMGTQAKAVLLLDDSLPDVPGPCPPTAEDSDQSMLPQSFRSRSKGFKRRCALRRRSTVGSFDGEMLLEPQQARGREGWEGRGRGREGEREGGRRGKSFISSYLYHTRSQYTQKMTSYYWKHCMMVSRSLYSYQFLVHEVYSLSENLTVGELRAAISEELRYFECLSVCINTPPWQLMPLDASW